MHGPYCAQNGRHASVEEALEYEHVTRQTRAAKNSHKLAYWLRLVLRNCIFLHGKVDNLVSATSSIALRRPSTVPGSGPSPKPMGLCCFLNRTSRATV